MYSCMHMYPCIYRYICGYTYVHMHMFVCMYACMYTYVYTSPTASGSVENLHRCPVSNIFHLPLWIHSPPISPLLSSLGG